MSGNAKSVSVIENLPQDPTDMALILCMDDTAYPFRDPSTIQEYHHDQDRVGPGYEEIAEQPQLVVSWPKPYD